MGASGTPVGGRIVRAYRRDTGVLIGTAISGDGVPTPGDSSFGNVQLLLHMDGANNATTATDFSSNPKSLTFSGASKLTSAGAKFGDAGLSAVGGVTAQTASAFTIGTQDFTFECSFYVVAFSPALASLFNIGAYNDGALFRVQAGKIELYINGTNYDATATISEGTWHDIAYSRQEGTMRVHLNTTLVAEYSAPGNIPAKNCLIGVSAHNAGEYLNGYIDELRLTVGVARYTGTTFAAHTSAFPNSASDVTVPLGAYAIDTTSFSGEVQVVCLDDDANPLENDLILRTVPV